MKRSALTMPEQHVLNLCTANLLEYWKDEGLGDLFPDSKELLLSALADKDRFLDDYVCTADGKYRLPLHNHYDGLMSTRLEQHTRNGKHAGSGVVQEIAYAMAEIAREHMFCGINPQDDDGDLSPRTAEAERKILQGYRDWDESDSKLAREGVFDQSDN
tara:strand:+ start:27186 stop:27662 length:477 start_codon:yes stop_codon:yes gene_type:complete